MQTAIACMTDAQPTQQRNVAPAITGLLSGVIALLYLFRIGQLQGYGVSAVFMLYAIIGGTITLVGVFSEWVVAELY